MKTAYDLLGAPRTATPSEIEHCYRFTLNAHIVECGKRRLSKRERAQVKAMRGAYLLLASPSRRRAYDHQLERRMQLRRRLSEAGGMALAVLSMLAGIALIGCAWPFRPPQPQRVQSPSLSAVSAVARNDSSSTAEPAPAATH